MTRPLQLQWQLWQGWQLVLPPLPPQLCLLLRRLPLQCRPQHWQLWQRRKQDLIAQLLVQAWAPLLLCCHRAVRRLLISCPLVHSLHLLLPCDRIEL